jgi:hypothetical protein
MVGEAIVSIRDEVGSREGGSRDGREAGYEKKHADDPITLMVRPDDRAIETVCSDEQMGREGPEEHSSWNETEGDQGRKGG